jgi:predicted enzyme related to lactoylglutathione lyase
MKKTITWFELPAANFERAVKFYEAIFDTAFERTEMGGNKYALFPRSQEGVGGALTEWPDFKPAEKETGVLIYLYAGDKLEEMTERVTEAGGKISTPKAFINEEYGYYSTIIDTEGNKVALHQPPG